MSPAERRRLAASADLSELTWESQLRPLHNLLNHSGGHRAIAV
jgi:hypothetical protein